MKLLEGLRKSITDSVLRNDGCAVLFSGGVDSTLIAAILKSGNRKFTCYTAGLAGSKDVDWANEVASQMGFSHVTCEIGDVEGIVKQVIRSTGLRDPVNVSISVPLFAACSNVTEKTVLTGMGADELFAGYSAFRTAKDVNSLCWKMLEKARAQDLLRDKAIASCFGLELRTPFLDIDVVRLAMQLPAEMKLSADQNKIILRQIARDVGVPEEVCALKKRAAQYGSGAMKALERLARSRRFKSVADYLNSI